MAIVTGMHSCSIHLVVFVYVGDRASEVVSVVQCLMLKNPLHEAESS